MKTFMEYLTESKKVYGFKVKVAGELPENFVENLKMRLAKVGLMTFEQIGKTPIQEAPLDFPEVANSEVTIFDVVTEYPTTPPEITQEILEMGVAPNKFKVRGSMEPSEQDQAMMDAELAEDDGALLNDPSYAENPSVEHKDYFGDEFNKSFLADLQKAAQERKKELANPEDPDTLSNATKEKDMGNLSPVGSK